MKVNKVLVACILNKSIHSSSISTSINVAYSIDFEDQQRKHAPSFFFKAFRNDGLRSVKLLQDKCNLNEALNLMESDNSQQTNSAMYDRAIFMPLLVKHHVPI